MYEARQNRKAITRVINKTKSNVIRNVNTKSTLFNQFIQRMRYDINVGGPFEYIIDKAALGNGTDTNKTTRNYVNSNVYAPNSFTLDYAIYNNLSNARRGNNAQFASFNNHVPNPQIIGARWDAGHSLARQNGGLGNNVNHVFPQNSIYNRGLGGTFPLWRAHEDNFHVLVNQFGYGRWRIR